MTPTEQKAFDAMREALEGIMRWQVKNVNVWHNSAYDIAHDALTAANAVSVEQFCYCNPDVSLQMVSGGGAPEGYLGRVTLRIGDQYRDYHSHPQATEPAAQTLSDEHLQAAILCREAGHVSVSMVQRKLNTGYNAAQKICQNIINAGLVPGLKIAPSLTTAAAPKAKQ